jgi:predicted nucleotidyltransferase
LKNDRTGYQHDVPGSGREFQVIEAALKKGAAALRDRGIPFALGGSLAAWARGGPESCNDLDLMVREHDAERALAALVEAGMRAERPPEGWLLKAWDGDVLVDLIHHAVGVPVTDEVLARAEELNVFAITMRVMALEDVLSSKLLSLNEHHLDYEPLITITRAVREQVDWGEVRARTSHSPYARAYFSLLEELGLDVAAQAPDATSASGKIRVLPS